MTEAGSVVFVVDGDPSVRRPIKRLVKSVGLQVELFGSAYEFLRSQRPNAPSCLVLDIRLPGISGLDLQRELLEANIHIPIIFITAHADIAMTVRAMKAGAVEFLTKPVREQDLLDAIRVALDRDRIRRERNDRLSELRTRFGTLSERERTVLSLVTSGMLNKQMAGKMNLSEVTVKVHRHNLMRKLAARSLPDLVKMAEALQINGKANA